MRSHVFGNEADIEGLPLTAEMSLFVDNLPSEISNVLDEIAENGGGAWIVGGAVRDASMGLNASDIDLATDLRPEQLLKIFPSAIETGVAFGTITVKSGDYLLQTTTLRIDGEYNDARRPESVQYELSLEKDLKRRDFTINAMAIDVARRCYYDPSNGMIDIKNRIIRSVGNPHKRINEDALRILRAFRFLGQMEQSDWRLEEQLSIAITECSYLISDLSKERIWQEFFKILSFSRACQILISMIDCGVLSIVFEWDKVDQTKVISALEESPKLDYAALFVLLNYDLNTAELKQLCIDLKLSKKQTREIISTSERARIIPSNDPRYLRLYRHLNGERSIQILELSRVLSHHQMVDKLSTVNSDYFAEIISLIVRLPPLTKTQQLVDGNWLMTSTGIKQGIRLGRLKEWLFRLQIENNWVSIAEVEQFLATIHWQSSDYEAWPQMSLE